MKKNDFAQIKGLDVKELILKGKTLKGEIMDLTLDKNMKKLKDTKSIIKKRKDLAQILTVVRQKELLSKLEGQQKEVVMDNSAEKSKLQKKGGTELSTKKTK